MPIAEMAEAQGRAQMLAKLFNDRVRSEDPAWSLNFVDCAIYEVVILNNIIHACDRR